MPDEIEQTGSIEPVRSILEAIIQTSALLPCERFRMAAAEQGRRRDQISPLLQGGYPAPKGEGRRDSRLRARIRAIALEPSRAMVLSARLVRMMGTRAPSTMPAI
jgi:hypothetical protein